MLLYYTFSIKSFSIRGDFDIKRDKVNKLNITQAYINSCHLFLFKVRWLLSDDLIYVSCKVR